MEFGKQPGQRSHFLHAIQRHGFALACVASLLGLGMLMLLLPDRSSEPVDVTSLVATADTVPQRSLGRERMSLGRERGSGFSLAEPRRATRLSVRTVPSGAVVSLGGDSVGRTPLRRNVVDPGTHRLLVQKEQYVSVDSTVTFQEGQLSSILLVLRQRTGMQEIANETPPSSSSRPAQQVQGPAENDEEEHTTAPETSQPAPSPSTGRVRFTSDPPGALVQLDGQQVGETPTNVEGLTPGTHEVVFHRSGHVERAATVEVAPRQQDTVHVALRKLGALRVQVRPWGSIYIDGRLHERETDVRYQTRLKPGRHRVRVVHPALGEQERTVRVVPGKVRAVVIDLNDRDS